MSPLLENDEVVCSVMGLLPMLFLSVLNWLIFRAVSDAHARHERLMSGSSHRRDHTMATLLTCIALIFLVCHLPKARLNICFGSVRDILAITVKLPNFWWVDESFRLRWIYMKCSVRSTGRAQHV